MNETNPTDNPETPPAVSAKRRQGRPRKDQILKRVETAPVPPGFERENKNQPHQVCPMDDANGGLVGQAVTGVVEAAFDAGYLLTVKVGNSNICLRGLVFNPGHYVPVTAENDVAPHVQMIRRSEIHLPMKNKNQRRRRKRIEQNGSSLPANEIHRLAPITANLVASRRLYTSPVAASFVQPVKFSNVSLPTNAVAQDAYRAEHMTATRGKHVQTVRPLAVLPPNASIPTTQVMATASETLDSQPQTNHQVTPKAVKNETRKPELLQREKVGSLKSTDMLMPGEIDKGALQSSEMNLESSRVTCKSSAEDVFHENVIEHLQDVHSVSNSSEHKKSGRMMQLLQALQKNMMENQIP